MILIISLLSVSFLSSAEENTQPQLDTPAVKATEKQWLMRLSHAMRTLNFNTSFVVVRNNRAEPYRWVHGNIEEQELELITLLNGPRNEAIRVNNKVSYLEPNKPPFSVTSEHISGPIPPALFGDIEKLSLSYDFVQVGKNRILGRPATLIRLQSKDKQRHGYWLWLDIESGLLLKIAIISRKGEILEQIQFTDLQISEQPNEVLTQLVGANVPMPLTDVEQQPALNWKVNWLPQGFEQITANRQIIGGTAIPTESLLFNDGLVDVSIYVNASNEAPRQPHLNQTGATVLLSMLKGGFEITVVGKIPANTAMTIAESVVFTNP